jgi:hypothetical protein
LNRGRIPSHRRSYRREPAAQGEELRDLIQLCLAGRVYDVERWIQFGRPIQALSYERAKKAAVVSPLRSAIRKKHRDLVLLLLSNGYRMDLETNEGNSVLDEAQALRAFDSPQSAQLRPRETLKPARQRDCALVWALVWALGRAIVHPSPDLHGKAPVG